MPILTVAYKMFVSLNMTFKSEPSSCGIIILIVYIWEQRPYLFVDLPVRHAFVFLKKRQTDSGEIS